MFALQLESSQIDPEGGLFGRSADRTRARLLVSKKRLTPARSSKVFAQLLLSLLLSGSALAQTAANTKPENSHPREYGSGWECDTGYREHKGKCLKVVVPANAHLSNRSYDRGWSCDWGYREQDGACALIKIPKNAFLDSSGSRWECHRRYQNVSGACAAIKVPANGYLANSAYGSGWKCNRGYRAEKDLSFPLKTGP